MFKFNEKLGETRGPAGGDKKGNPFKKYIPVEEIADNIPNMEESEENEVLSDKEDSSELEFSSIDDMEEKEKRNKGNMSREIGFEEGEGVAHIGPDFKNLEVNKNKGEILDFNQEKNPISLPMIRSVKGVRDIWSLDKFNRDKKAKGHDNLKTTSDSKKSRSLRQKIAKFLDGQNN